MLKYLKTWQSRFDKMSLRERVLIVAAAAALLYFAFDVAVVAPGAARKKAIAQRIEAQQAEHATVRKQIEQVTGLLTVDPNAAQLAQLASMKMNIAEADALIRQLDSNAPQVTAVLKELLAGSAGLKLVSLKTLPVSVLFQSKAAPVAAPAAAAAGTKDAAPKPAAQPRPPVTIYRHGIEIDIRGNYLSLLPYLDKIQKYPKPLFWGDASLRAGEYPEAVMTLHVFAISGQPAAPLQ
jgi:MSHA biogenesis protein MshJ